MNTELPAPAAPRGTIAILGAMFFIFGFVTWLNGPLISFVKLAFSLSDVGAFLVPMVFYLSYLVLALPSAAILRRTGMKRGMALGLGVMAVGAVLFGQFATMHWFPGALAGLFVIGGGLAVLQTAANPYVVLAGPPESAARRIAVMGICNKGAGMLAPIVFGLLVMQGVGDLAAEVANTAPEARTPLLESFAQKVHSPYLAMAAILALLALGVWRSSLPDLQAAEDRSSGGDWRGLLGFRHLWLGAVALFLYVGVEVMAGDAIGIYGEAFGLPFEQTAYFTSLTLGGMMMGYVAGLVLIPRVVSQERYLALSALLGAAAAAGAWATHGYVSVGFVAALGFANAMMWPAIFPLAIKGLGRHTGTGSAILVMAISGGAVVPQLFALLKQVADFQWVFLVLVAPSYLFIWYFAVRGSRPVIPSA